MSSFYFKFEKSQITQLYVCIVRHFSLYLLLNLGKTNIFESKTNRTKFIIISQTIILFI